MQTEAEKYLIKIVRKILTKSNQALKIINLGAAKSTVVENELLQEKKDFICDRADIEDCNVNEDYVERTYICPLEDLSLIDTAKYDLAFANFVLEHVSDPDKAAKEMARILKPSGEIVISLSNPKAPEFRLAKATPTWFHQLFRKAGHDDAYPVKYAYKNINNFILSMALVGFEIKEKKYFPATYSYLHRYPVINLLSRAYDKIVVKGNWKNLMGHTVLHFRKS